MGARHLGRRLSWKHSSLVLLTPQVRNVSSLQQRSPFRTQITESRSPRFPASITSSKRTLSASSSPKEAAQQAVAAQEDPLKPSQSIFATFRLPNKPDKQGNLDKLDTVDKILDKMLRPQSIGDDNAEFDKNMAREYGSRTDPAKLSQVVQRGLLYPPLPKPKVHLRLTPSLGRSVAVDLGKGMDLARALRMMEGMCARNNVRHQEREQKFHVRRGQLKKDIRSRRWRKLFKVSFQKTIARCERMRSQGW